MCQSPPLAVATFSMEAATTLIFAEKWLPCSHSYKTLIGWLLPQPSMNMTTDLFESLHKSETCPATQRSGKQCCSVGDHSCPEWNAVTAVWWITIEAGTDNHNSCMMNSIASKLSLRQWNIFTFIGWVGTVSPTRHSMAQTMNPHNYGTPLTVNLVIHEMKIPSVDFSLH